MSENAIDVNAKCEDGNARCAKLLSIAPDQSIVSTVLACLQLACGLLLTLTLIGVLACCFARMRACASGRAVHVGCPRRCS